MPTPPLSLCYARICAPERFLQAPDAMLSNWALAKAAHGQAITPERIARLTPHHDVAGPVRGRTIGQAMSATGSVAEQIQPYCQRSAARLAEILGQRTGGSA